MLSKTRGIIIHNTGYGDNGMITRIYTEAFGQQSYIIKGVKNSRKGGIRPAQLMPLTLCELVVYHKPQNSLQSIREFRCSPPLYNLHHELMRSSVALFVADVLNRVFRDNAHPDEELFAFLFNFIQLLDIEEQGLPYMPLYFMAQLTRYLGFQPTGDYFEGGGFNVVTGSFQPDTGPSRQMLDAEQSRALAQLVRTPVSNLPDLVLPRLLRVQLLQSLISYFDIHQHSLGQIHSHEILGEVFS